MIDPSDLNHGKVYSIRGEEFLTRKKLEEVAKMVYVGNKNGLNNYL